MSPRRKPPRRTGPGRAAPSRDDRDDEDGSGAGPGGSGGSGGSGVSSGPAGLAGRIHGYDRIEAGPDGEWAVRAVTGSAASKPYRCPGCDQEIRSGLPHVVTWPTDRFGVGIDERRHWHTPCWGARGRRR